MVGGIDGARDHCWSPFPWLGPLCLMLGTRNCLCLLFVGLSFASSMTMQGSWQKVLRRLPRAFLGVVGPGIRAAADFRFTFGQGYSVDELSPEPSSQLRAFRRGRSDSRCLRAGAAFTHHTDHGQQLEAPDFQRFLEANRFGWCYVASIIGVFGASFRSRRFSSNLGRLPGTRSASYLRTNRNPGKL